jgi:hypothetical protein
LRIGADVRKVPSFSYVERVRARIIPEAESADSIAEAQDDAPMA